jgi:hypothetical protein
MYRAWLRGDGYLNPRLQLRKCGTGSPHPERPGEPGFTSVVTSPKVRVNEVAQWSIAAGHRDEVSEGSKPGNARSQSRARLTHEVSLRGPPVAFSPPIGGLFLTWAADEDAMPGQEQPMKERHSSPEDESTPEELDDDQVVEFAEQIEAFYSDDEQLHGLGLPRLLARMLDYFLWQAEQLAEERDAKVGEVAEDEQ